MGIYRILLLTLLFSGRCFAECVYCFPYDEVPCSPWIVGFSGEFLYFKTAQDGLNLGNIFDLGSPPTEGSSNFSALIPGFPVEETGVTVNLYPIGQKALRMNPGWSKGFRVGFEVQPPESKLNLYLDYSYYTSNDSKGWYAAATPNPFATMVNAPSISPLLIGDYIDQNINVIEGFNPQGFAIPQSVNLTSVIAAYNLKIQEYQLAMSYALNFGNEFMFRPYAGVKGLLIEQVLNCYQTYSVSSTTVMVDSYERVAQHLRFRAFGLEGGMYGKWSIGKGFYAYGDLCLALLIGKQELHGFSETSVVDDEMSVASVYEINRDPQSSKACFDSAVGFCFKTPQIYNLVRGIFRIAWENHIYFKQNFFAQMGNSSNFEKTNMANGDLSTYGITVSGELVF